MSTALHRSDRIGRTSSVATSPEAITRACRRSSPPGTARSAGTASRSSTRSMAASARAGARLTSSRRATARSRWRGSRAATAAAGDPAEAPMQLRLGSCPMDRSSGAGTGRRRAAPARAGRGRRARLAARGPGRSAARPSRACGSSRAAPDCRPAPQLAAAADDDHAHGAARIRGRVPAAGAGDRKPPGRESLPGGSARRDAAAGRRPGALDASSPARCGTDGPRPTAGARQIHHALLGIIVANEPGLRANLDTEFLHDFRVAVRRTRSLLGQVRQVFPASRRRALLDRVLVDGAPDGPAARHGRARARARQARAGSCQVDDIAALIGFLGAGAAAGAPPAGRGAGQRSLSSADVGLAGVSSSGRRRPRSGRRNAARPLVRGGGAAGLASEPANRRSSAATIDEGTAPRSSFTSCGSRQEAALSGRHHAVVLRGRGSRTHAGRAEETAARAG